MSNLNIAVNLYTPRSLHQTMAAQLLENCLCLARLICSSQEKTQLSILPPREYLHLPPNLFSRVPYLLSGHDQQLYSAALPLILSG